MIMHKGGMFVEKGLYWNPMDGQGVNMRRDGTLPGNETRNYLKMSPMVLLVIAPLLGMMYVLFLPLFGIGVFFVIWLVPIIGTLAAVALTGIKVCSRSDGKGVSFNWRPTRAHFSGAPQKGKKNGRSQRVAHGMTDSMSRQGKEV